MFKTGIVCDQAHRKENDQHGASFASESEALNLFRVNTKRIGKAVHQRLGEAALLAGLVFGGSLDKEFGFINSNKTIVTKESSRCENDSTAARVDRLHLPPAWVLVESSLDTSRHARDRPASPPATGFSVF